MNGEIIPQTSFEAVKFLGRAYRHVRQKESWDFWDDAVFEAGSIILHAQDRCWASTAEVA